MNGWDGKEEFCQNDRGGVEDACQFTAGFILGNLKGLN